MNLMRAAVLANYVEVVRDLGLDPETQLRGVGLSAQMIRLPDRLVPSDAVARLLENSASTSGCTTIGLRMAEHRRMSHFGAVGLLLSQQRTIRDVYRAAMAYLPLLNEALALELEESGGTAVLREDVLTDAVTPTHQVTELAMAANLQLFRAIAGAGWHPRRVFFRHAAPDALELHRRVFRCRCEFSAEFNGMSFPAADLDVRNPAADPEMARYAEDFLRTLPGQEQRSTAARVRRLIYLFLPLGRATVKQVAQSLGCSVRKLQSDLDEANTSFAALLEAARADRVCVYLENPRFQLGQVAALLGYTHQSSFTRWFIGRFGMSPRAWRNSVA